MRSHRSQQNDFKELLVIANTKAPVAGHEVIDVPAKQEYRDQRTEEGKGYPNSHPLLLLGARNFQGAPFADRGLYSRRGRSMKIEIAEDLQPHRTTLVGTINIWWPLTPGVRFPAQASNYRSTVVKRTLRSVANPDPPKLRRTSRGARTPRSPPAEIGTAGRRRP